MTKNFTQNPAAGDLDGSEVVPAVQAGADVKTTIAAILAKAWARASHTGEQAISTITGLQTALNLKAADADVVHDTGNETIAGVKTFSSAPVVPDASWTIAKTSGLQAALDALPVDSSVVHDTGNETIAGIKTFTSSPIVPLSPTTPTQAASKGYVDSITGAVGLRVEDEGGSVVAAATGINFVGAGVTVTNAGSNEALVTVNTAAKHPGDIWVTDYGAFGDGFTDDTAAIQAAIDAATTVGARLGARVVFPSGTYVLSDELVLPLTSPVTFIELAGFHMDTSRLYWPADLGAGKFGIRQEDTSNYPYAVHIHDLHLIGAGASAPIVDGTPPALMNGIQMKQRWVLERLNIQYFNAGITPFDHTSVRECVANGNYYGMRWTGPPMGDIYVEHCDFGSNRMASIGVESGLPMVSTQWNSCHFGINSPYAIYLESGATPGFFADNQWINCSFEYLTLGLLYDEDNDATIQDQEFLGGGCSWNPASNTTMGRTRTELIRTSKWTGISNRGNVTFYITASGVPAVRCAEFSRNHMESFEADQAAATTNGVALVVGPAAGACNHNEWRYRGGSTRGRFAVTGSAVTAGQVVAQRNVGTVRAYNLGNANEPVAGIAMATLAGAGVVPFAVEGEAIRCLYTGTPVAADYAVISTTAKDKIESYPVTDAARANLPAPVLGTIYTTATTDADGLSRVPITLVISHAANPSTLMANTQTASYALVATDAGKVVEMNVAGANTLTVPLNATIAFPIGTVIEVYQMGAGQTTLTPESGSVTLTNFGSKFKLAGQGATATLRKRATNEWVVGGEVTA